MGKRTEAVYWERIREEISDGVHDQLKDEMLNYQKNASAVEKGCRMTHVLIYVMHVTIEGLGSRTGSSNEFFLMLNTQITYTFGVRYLG